MKRTILTSLVIMAWLLVPIDSHAQCPAQENVVYYNYQGNIHSVDLVSQAETTVLNGSGLTDIGGVALVNPGSNIVFNCLAANPDIGDLVYFANGTSIFGLTPSTGVPFLISDLAADFPSDFSGFKLESGGGSFYNGHYYVGADCIGIYDITLTADGMSVATIEEFSDLQFQYGDLIVVAEGCSGEPTMFVSSGASNGTEPCLSATDQLSGLYSIDLMTKDTVKIAPGTSSLQLAVSGSGVVYASSGPTIQVLDPCTGILSGTSFDVTLAAAINDLTGPGICPQPEPPIVLVPDFDTIPGYNTAAIDVLANDPNTIDPTSALITKNGQNGSATLSGSTITYTPTFGFTGYDTICYAVCTPSGLVCDTTIAVFAIGDDHDMDGLLDVNECPSWDLDVASCDIDGDNIPNIYDVDSDNDSILDEYECPLYNGTVTSCDTDSDGLPDYLDTDSDGDGLTDMLECSDWTGTGCDTDGDGVPNFRDTDSDGDSFLDGTFTEFPTSDCDTDGVSDYLDPDPCELIIPEGFSPNGDGNNDLFEIVGLQAFPNNHLRIFNRWGELVLDQPNYQNNWVGDNQGKQEVIKGDLLPVGTYYVIFEYESLGSTRTYEGICYIQY